MSDQKHRHKEDGLSPKAALKLKAEEMRQEAKAEYRAAEEVAHAQHNHKLLRKDRYRYHEELHSISVFIHEDAGGL